MSVPLAKGLLQFWILLLIISKYGHQSWSVRTLLVILLLFINFVKFILIRLLLPVWKSLLKHHFLFQIQSFWLDRFIINLNFKHFFNSSDLASIQFYFVLKFIAYFISGSLLRCLLSVVKFELFEHFQKTYVIIQLSIDVHQIRLVMVFLLRMIPRLTFFGILLDFHNVLNRSFHFFE